MGPIVRNELFFFITIVALAALMVLFEAEEPPAGRTAATRAARRKALWTARRERLWMASVYTSSFVFIVMVTAEFIYEKSASALSPATEVTFVDGKVSHPAEADLRRRSAPVRGHGEWRLKCASGFIRSPMEKSPLFSTPAKSAARWAFTKARMAWSARTAQLPLIRSRSGCPAAAIRSR